MARYFDVHPENPQARSIHQAVEIVRSGGLIAYPTDSCYALGAQLGSREALDRIRSIRNLDSKRGALRVCMAIVAGAPRDDGQIGLGLGLVIE